ncbi:MAG: uridine kinase [Caldisericaceae bacterium]|nr:uridine kinase [Caldisericaceae bacterium]
MSWPKFIGVAGGTGSGKTTVAKLIQERLGKDKTAIISMDSYYKDFPNLSLSERKKINYDHPSAFDIELFKNHLLTLKSGKCVNIPVYSFSKYERTGETIKVCPAPVIIVEGILLFYDEGIRNLFDIKIFIDADSDVRIIRRIRRDVLKRGRDLRSVTQQYLNTVRPMHIQFVEPTKQFADIIIPRGGKNEIAMDIIIAKIKSMIHEYGKENQRY